MNADVRKARRKSALLKEAKDTLGLKGKRRSNPITTALFLGFIPTQGGKELTPSKTGAYAVAVETEVIKRFVNTLQPISTSITLNYTYRFKHQGAQTPSQQGVKSTTITGTRATMDTLIQDQLTEWKDDLEQNSPELMQRFETVKIDKPVILSFDKKQNKFISKSILAVKMKRMGALKLDYDYLGDCSWDRHMDTCVFDWIYHEYSGKSGFKTFLPQDRELAYDNLNHLFAEVDDGYPLMDGVTINQLQRFADRFRLPMMAFDKTEKIICSTRPVKVNKEVKPLMFIIANAHLYPIEDKTKRMRMGAKVREDKLEDRFGSIQNWKSCDFEESAKDEKKKEECPPPIFTDGVLVGNPYVLSIIKERRVIPKKIRVEGSNIVRFCIGMQWYHTSVQSVIEARIEHYITDKGETYWGQSPNYMLGEIYLEVFKTEVYTCGTSLFHPAVYDLFMDKKIKHRQHYGATKDNTALLEWCKEEFDQVDKEVDVSHQDVFGAWRKQKGLVKIQVARPRRSILDKLFEDKQAVCYDLNKSYTSCLYDPDDEFLRYDEEDTIYPFQQDLTRPLPTGLYYVETDDLTLLHQSNWYSNKIIDLAVTEHIPLRVTYEFIPVERLKDTKLLPRDTFKTFVERAYETPIGKEIINTFIGCLGRTMQKSKVVECDTDVDLVWNCFVNCEKPTNENDYDHLFFNEGDEHRTRLHKKNIILQNLNTDEDPLYLYGHHSVKGQNEIALPIWIQLLDWSNIRLYQMTKSVGGEILFRKTDCIVSLGGKVGLSKEGFNHFKSADWQHLKLDSLQKTDRHISSWQWKSSWTHHDYTSSGAWQEIVELALDKGGLLIEGRAGTGKSYIPHQAFDQGVFVLGENTVSASFTNKASRAIRGQTLHKLLKITGKNTIPKRTMDGLKKFKYFVIDEIGMISPFLWRLLKLVKQSHPSSIWILMGDYRQLPPITEDNRVDIDVFHLPIVKYLTNYNKIELTERQRYDLPLWNYLEKGYEEHTWGELPSRSVTPDEIYNGKAICYFNSTRDFVNDTCMDYFKRDGCMELRYQREDVKDKPKTIFIYEGLPVMAYKNCKDLEIVNSDEFVVTEYNTHYIVLHRDVVVTVSVEDFHTYFVCNYCSTTHKSQGATYTGNIFILDWERIQKHRNVAYTACSRGTALDKLTIVQEIRGLERLG